MTCFQWGKKLACRFREALNGGAPYSRFECLSAYQIRAYPLQNKLLRGVQENNKLSSLLEIFLHKVILINHICPIFSKSTTMLVILDFIYLHYLSQYNIHKQFGLFQHQHLTYIHLNNHINPMFLYTFAQIPSDFSIHLFCYRLIMHIPYPLTTRKMQFAKCRRLSNTAFWMNLSKYDHSQGPNTWDKQGIILQTSSKSEYLNKEFQRQITT